MHSTQTCHLSTQGVETDSWGSLDSQPSQPSLSFRKKEDMAPEE